MSELLEQVKSYAAAKVANMKKPEATVDEFKLVNISWEGVAYSAKASVSNPYMVPLPICEISYILKSAGRMIASGNVDDPGSLVANETTIMEVPVKVPHSVLVSLARDICADWDIDYQLDLGFIIDLPAFGNITIPLSITGEIKLPTLSDYL